MSITKGYIEPGSFLATFLLVAASACGHPTAASQLKIRDGRAVSLNSSGPERVSTAGLRGTSSEGGYICSAAIIGDDLLLTAGHCVEPGAELYAYFGPNMNSASSDEFIPASGELVDPQYQHSGTAGGLPLGDLALVRLSASIPYGYQPIALLPNNDLLQTGETVELAGYGITESGDGSGVLRFTKTTYAGLDEAGRLQIQDSAQRGACSGDSGGPFFASSDGSWYLAGVLSGGPVPCRGVNVYTPVASFSGFIQQGSSSI